MPRNGRQADLLLAGMRRRGVAARLPARMWPAAEMMQSPGRRSAAAAAATPAAAAAPPAVPAATAAAAAAISAAAVAAAVAFGRLVLDLFKALKLCRCHWSVTEGLQHSTHRPLGQADNWKGEGAILR